MALYNPYVYCLRKVRSVYWGKFAQGLICKVWNPVAILLYKADSIHMQRAFQTNILHWWPVKEWSPRHFCWVFLHWHIASLTSWERCKTWLETHCYFSNIQELHPSVWSLKWRVAKGTHKQVFSQGFDTFCLGYSFKILFRTISHVFLSHLERSCTKDVSTLLYCWEVSIYCDPFSNVFTGS